MCVSNKFTGFADTRSARSFPLLMFLGAGTQQELRFSGNAFIQYQPTNNIVVLFKHVVIVVF